MRNLESDDNVDRTRALKAVVPFLVLGLADLAALLLWGLNPLWGVLILPPILFISVLAWIGFRTGFIDDRAEEPASPTDDRG